MPSKPYTLLELSPDLRKRRRLLNKINTLVPPRSEKRDPDHTEIYSIVWMLRTDRQMQLRYPVQVIHTDRPDIQLRSSDVVIGIEITEAVSSNNASMDELREKEPHLWHKPDEEFAIYYPRKAVPGEDKLSAKVKRQIIRDNDPGEGWCGTGADDWANAISYFAAEKVKKVKGYTRFDENWLLIYDNWDEPGRRVELADSALSRTLHDQAVFETFDRVLVLDDHSLASFSQAGFRRQGRPRHGK
ncbi:hypothetical protein [Pseudomonas sp.]|nr:hypothetical protein [Pseudomonas sp.]